MINSTEHIPCTDGLNYRRYHGISLVANETSVAFTVDFRKSHEEKMIRDLNVRLGNFQRCECGSCSPRTGNE